MKISASTNDSIEAMGYQLIRNFQKGSKEPNLSERTGYINGVIDMTEKTVRMFGEQK